MPFGLNDLRLGSAANLFSQLLISSHKFLQFDTINQYLLTAQRLYELYFRNELPLHKTVLLLQRLPLELNIKNAFLHEMDEFNKSIVQVYYRIGILHFCQQSLISNPQRQFLQGVLAEIVVFLQQYRLARVYQLPVFIIGIDSRQQDAKDRRDKSILVDLGQVALAAHVNYVHLHGSTE
jgi:hypothetical protein